MNGHYLFVYGTLKRGYGNNARCLEDAEFIGKAVTATASYVMQSGGFPILWDLGPSRKGAFATGEIFIVSNKTRARCDSLEGHPNMYRREKRNFVVTLVDGTQELIEAWVYLWQRERNWGDPVKPDANNKLTWDREGARIRNR
jgi:gamma-glutamylaminecyclotransferase